MAAVREQAASSQPFRIASSDDIAVGLLETDLVVLGAPTGAGKCLAPNTPVLPHDGEVVRADAVRVGDALMGPDSKPRKVLGIGGSRCPGPLGDSPMREWLEIIHGAIVIALLAALCSLFPL